MKKYFILILICAFGLNSFSQEYINSDNFKFKYIRADRATFGNYNYTVKTMSEDVEKIKVRFKMKSISGKKENFDPNKFYLVADDFKLRMKPMDLRHNYGVGMMYIGFDYLVDFQPTELRYREWLMYKPEITDTFYDYKIEGYTDVVPNINFGTQREPKIVSPYLDHRELKSCKIDVYFSLPKDLKSFKVYYGNQLLSETTIK